MTDRILDITDSPVRLSRDGDLLVLSPQDGDKVTIPIEELTAVIAAHPQVQITQGALAGMAKFGTIFVACDEKRAPAAILLPLNGHTTQAERFARQADAPLPKKKRLWQAIVTAKIKNQAWLLRKLNGNDEGLEVLAQKVRSGDPDNLEAVAAQRYWKSIFSDSNFRRDRSADDQNRHLNYGYAVLRSAVLRALCGAGLHPSLGLHHHNRYDSFCLASDLMEPIRPLIDWTVAEIVALQGRQASLDKTAKTKLIETMNKKVLLDKEWRKTFDACVKMAQSLAGIFEGSDSEMVLPELSECPEET